MMKQLLVLTILGMVAMQTYAQSQDSLGIDSTKKDTTSEIRIGGIKISPIEKKYTLKTKKKKQQFFGGITFSRMDLGLSRFIDKGSLALSQENSYLELTNWSTHNVGVEFFELGYRFSDHFKMYLAAGLDWTHVYFSKNVTLQKDQPRLTYIEETIDFKRNRLTSQYIRLPLALDLRSKKTNGSRFHFVIGPELGFLINSNQKQVSEERGKVKVTDDFNLAPFRYGGFVRVGYGSFGLYTKYYFNDVFAKNQGPANFKNIAVGLMLGFY